MRTLVIVAIVVSCASSAFCGEKDTAPTGDDPSRAVVIQSASTFLSGLTREVQQKGDIRMKADDILEMMARNERLTIVDVRTPQERAVVAIPNSLAIPIDELLAHLDRIPRDHRVVMVCHSGPRSIIAATVLRILGYDNVYALNGGIHALADVTAKTAPEISSGGKKTAPAATLEKGSKADEEEYSELGDGSFSCN